MNSSPLDRLQQIYAQPFFDLIQHARTVYLQHWQNNEVQLCTLLSIKTGGCSEDCAYCAQSARYEAGVQAERLMSAEEVLEVARRAKSGGSTRFCMGAAWKGVKEGTAGFDSVLGIVREVSRLGMEVCVTLGQLTDQAARQLREAGVTAYNHNLDTSPEFYPQIVTTHTFQDRLGTIRAVQQAGMSVCSGGIIGMGETVTDRLRMLEVLTGFRTAARKRADQLFDGHARHTAGRTAARGRVRVGAAGGDDTHRLAPLESAALGRAFTVDAGSAGAVFLCRRELHLLRQQTPYRR